MSRQMIATAAAATVLWLAALTLGVVCVARGSFDGLWVLALVLAVIGLIVALFRWGVLVDEEAGRLEAEAWGETPADRIAARQAAWAALVAEANRKREMSHTLPVRSTPTGRANRSVHPTRMPLRSHRGEDRG